MIFRYCLLIDTSKSVILEDEAEELLGQGMFGKALLLYLQAMLTLAVLNVPFFCKDDCGWGLQAKCYEFRIFLCIYADPDPDPDSGRYALTPSIQSPRQGTG